MESRHAALLLILIGGMLLSRPAFAAPPIKLLALGDSLTAGYGLPTADGFTEQLQAALAANGRNVVVINAGVSGDTSAGGLATLEWLLADHPDAALVELGANDMLRGLDPKETEANLGRILDRLKQAKIPVLLCGMRSSRNWGQPYQAAFDNIYPELAKQYGVALYPFFLDGVALDPAMMQPDGIHPNAAGVKVIVSRILPYVEDLLPAR